MFYYAVAKGKQIGIYLSWLECKNQVIGFGGAIYKKFSLKKEAEDFINRYSGGTSLSGTSLSGTSLSANATSLSGTNAIDYYVYTDGSCSNNGRANAKAGIGVYFGQNDPRNISKPINGKQTNNTAELSAIIAAYEAIEADLIKGKQITIVSDSEYAIRCATSYGKRCSQEGWTKQIPNMDLVKQIYNLYNDKPNVKFLHVMAHTNNTDIHSIGNANADSLANASV